MDSRFIPQEEKGLRRSHGLLPSALTSQLPLPTWLGTCVTEVSGGAIRDRAGPTGGPGGRRVPGGFSFRCTADIPCTLSGLVGHLHPRQQGTAEGCHRRAERQACEPGRLASRSLHAQAALGPQCGGFTAPRPRCCCCCCCIRSCSSAEGPGRVMELDQMDFRLSMRTAEESSTEGPWPAQVPAGVLTWCQLLSEDGAAER